MWKKGVYKTAQTCGCKFRVFIKPYFGDSELECKEQGYAVEARAVFARPSNREFVRVSGVGGDRKRLAADSPTRQLPHNVEGSKRESSDHSVRWVELHKVDQADVATIC